MKSPRLQRLIESAKLLSAEASQQLTALSSMGVPDVVDELALNFDDDVRLVDSMVADGELGRAAQAAAENLDRHLGNMSGEGNAHLWTPEALRTSSEWSEVRRLAAHLLEVIELESETP